MDISLAGARPSLAEYEAWLLKSHKTTNFSILKNHYETVTRELADSYRECDFWKSIVSNLRNVDAQYLVDHKYPLIADFSPAIVIKPWNSFIEKTYRKNIAHNNNFPESPDGGWLQPDNWYIRIHDIVRTTLVVKYLDGVPLIAEYLRSIASENNVSFEFELEARVDGYYGAHCVRKGVPNFSS